MKKIALCVLTLMLLTSCGQSEPITFPYIIAAANGHPLLKYNIKTCTVSTLCPDVYCEHLSTGSTDEICEFALFTGYPIAGKGGIYYTRQAESDGEILFELKYYDYTNQSVRLIGERDYLTGLFYQDGSLYWWEHFYAEGSMEKLGSHLYRYDEGTERITRLTDASNYYGSDDAPWVGFPKLIYVSRDTLYFLSYPTLYRSDPDLEKIESIPLCDLEMPKDTVLPYGNGYLHNGWQYFLTDGEIPALMRQNIKTGETESLAEAVVCFVMDDAAVYWQPYETEGEIHSAGGVSRTNHSRGRILRYDPETGATAEILNKPELHFEESLYLRDHVLMVRMYGITVDQRDGSERYDVLPHAMFFKDGAWITTENGS